MGKVYIKKDGTVHHDGLLSKGKKVPGPQTQTHSNPLTQLAGTCLFAALALVNIM